MHTLTSRILGVIVLSATIGSIVPLTAVHASDSDRATCWISASPSRIYEGGSTTLYWGSGNADNAWISDIGEVIVAGSRVVYDIDEDTTFKLTVENDEGTGSCETDVEVTNYYTPSDSGKAPGCTMYRERAAWGSSVILHWTSTNATSAFLSSVGSVPTSGSYTVNAPYTSLFTLTVYGNGKSHQCEIEVDGGYGTYYPASYPQYAAPYVYLTQIPYTGFDFGPVGTAVYFLVLMLFALSGAYLTVYYRGGTLSYVEVMQAARNQIRAIKSLVE